MNQIALFDALLLVPSPLCVYDPECKPKGKAELGEVERWDGGENRSITCLQCKRTGTESRRTT